MRDAPLLALLAAASLGGCKGASPGPPEPGPTPGEAPVGVALRLDGAEVARIAPASVTGARELATWLPEDAPLPSAWTLLEADAGKGRKVELFDFGARMADARVVLEPGSGGGLRLTVLPRLDDDLPDEVRPYAGQPLATLDDLRSVTVRTSGQAAAVPGDSGLQVSFRDTSRTLSASDLDRLAATDGDGERRGVSLGRILDEVARPGAVARVILHARGGERRVLTDADLDGPDELILRFNRQGLLRYERFRAGLPRRIDGLRGVTHVEAVPRPAL